LHDWNVNSGVWQSLDGLVVQKIFKLYPNKLSQLTLICLTPKFSKCAYWSVIDPKVLDCFTQ